ncbi:MAG: hypothetical protein KH416_04085 [Dialister sp.]|uniref:hypothetical protein n=1 Tax=Dialister sp. TaxID=1955814 RepID=UPI00257E9C5B|nr:hypothetical protein [Dialister sp.]MBS6295284.1 hypothetical protein [Dialister sp.]
MENFILDSFGATIKLMIFLCMIVIFIVKSMQFYMKQHEFWSMQVKLLYILFISLYLGGNIAIIGGVTGTFTTNWGSIAVRMIITGTIVGGIFVRTLRKRYAMHFSKQELEKYGFAEKGLWMRGIGLMVIVLITYPYW